jgi:hypothetical protein
MHRTIPQKRGFGFTTRDTKNQERGEIVNTKGHRVHREHRERQLSSYLDTEEHGLN